MKNIMKLVFLMVAVLGMTSCDLLNVNVDSSVEGTLDVYVDEPMAKSTNAEGDFNVTKVITPSDADDFSDKIEDVEVNEVIVKVESVNHEGVVLSAGTTFYITDGDKTASWSKGEDWPIFNGEEVVFGDVQGEYAKAAALISKALISGDDLTIGTYGNSSKTGVYFSLTLITGITVKASLL